MVSSKILGERTAFLRKRAGLTQAQLASRLGVARTTLVAIENGERRLEPHEVLSAAEALGVPVHDLMRPNYATAAAAPRFRLAPKGDVSHQDLSRAVRQLEDLGRSFLELELLAGIVPRPSPLDVVAATQSRSIDPSSAGEQSADQVRAALGLGDGPIPELETELGVAGVRIFNLEVPPKIAGIFLWGDEIGPCIAINRVHPRSRRRFSLAHELGHVLRDREAGDVYLGEDPKRDPSELFADSFAKELLMPRSNVMATFNAFVRANGDKFSPADLIGMANVYGVSFQAVTLRLEELGLLRRGTYFQLVERKFKPDETARRLGLTPDDEPARELPDRFVSLAVKAFDEELLSESELAKYLRVDRVAARGIARARRMHTLDDGERVELDLGRDLLGK